jgi:ketosteroid isomerase-like protein
MRNLFMAGCALLLVAGGPPAGDDPQAAIRAAAERLRYAILQKDKTALEALLHPDYRLSPGAGGFRPSSGSGKAQAIAYYTDRTFVTLKSPITTVRIFGDTAVETGSLTATLREFNQNSYWGGIYYTRVWVRDANGWRLAHEHY